MAKLLNDDNGYVILTEHKIGDTFWEMISNKPTECKILSVNVSISGDSFISESYDAGYLSINKSCYTHFIRKPKDIKFRTKEELIASL